MFKPFFVSEKEPNNNYLLQVRNIFYHDYNTVLNIISLGAQQDQY